MNICGIVAEYNPFHLGHLLHIEETRRILGPDCVTLCVMSGNYVQRGDFAVMNKHARAKAAVLSGADLILELPTPYALSSAEGFARAAVGLISASGVATHLSFGSEEGSIRRLRLLADALLSDDLPPFLQRELQKGVSFASARQKAAAALVGSETAALLALPNNILGVEYMKALTMLKSEIEPITIPRIGASHDGNSARDGTASASCLRSLLSKGDVSALKPYMPEASFALLNEEMKKGAAPVLLKNADRSILSFLKRLDPEDYLSYPDVGEGLEKRLYSAVSQGLSFEEICDLAKTKRYAHSRIRRILLSAYLGVTRELSASPPPYLRVLAFNQNGQALLKQMKKRALIPVVTKPASVNALGSNAARLFALEKTATDLYNLAYPVLSKTAFREYRESPVALL